MTFTCSLTSERIYNIPKAISPMLSSEDRQVVSLATDDHMCTQTDSHPQ